METKRNLMSESSNQ